MNPLPAASRPSVVVIDDTADLRDLLHIALDRGGFEVVGEAGDGQSGIEVVRQHRPDLVLLDLAMPIMDGIEALPSIRRLVPHASIVVLSGFGAQHMSARAVAAGADGYVQKGAPLKTIIDYVDNIMRGNDVPRPVRALSVVPAGPAQAEVGETPHPHSEMLETPHNPRATSTAPMPGHPVPDPVAVSSTHEEHDPTPETSEAAIVTDSSTYAPAHAAERSERSERPEQALATRPHTEGTLDRVSSLEAVQLAPYGVLELADEPLFRLVHTNPMGARLLGTEKVGQPLAMVAPELASMVSYYRLDSDAAFEVDINGIRVRGTLRRTGWSVLVFLDSAAEDVGMLRRAIATTAHEVRGPVAVLCGVAETLAWDGNVMTPEQNGRLMASVARQARILDRITADLLTAAQIQRGTLRIDLAVVDPVAVARQVVEDRYAAQVVVEDTGWVRADPVRLEQMLTNLLSNAQKYGAAPFVVRIRPAVDEPEFVCIDVEDRGDGVPGGFTEHLFREFARAQDAVATGTGLGLYVVRTLAQAQNGEVSYRPASPHGSVFTITLHRG